MFRVSVLLSISLNFKLQREKNCVKKRKYLFQTELWVNVNFKISKTNVLLKSKYVINRNVGQHYYTSLDHFLAQADTQLYGYNLMQNSGCGILMLCLTPFVSLVAS